MPSGAPRVGGFPRGAVGSAIAAGAYGLQVDEPPAIGGEGTAPNPVEVYLGALISCQIVTYRFWAQRLGIVVDDLSIEPKAIWISAGSSASTAGFAPGFRRFGSG